MKKIYSLLLLAGICLFGAQSVKAATVYFVNGAGWDAVYCYAYDDGGDEDASWPGIVISQTAIVNGFSVYSYDTEKSIVIFNNGSGGSGNQTANLTVSGHEEQYFYKSQYEEVWFESGKKVSDFIASGSKYKAMYLRGEMNGWGTTEMDEIRTNVWKVTVTLTNEEGDNEHGWYGYKFDTGNWTTFFGRGSYFQATINQVATVDAGGSENLGVHVEETGDYSFILDVTGETPKFAVANSVQYGFGYYDNEATDGETPSGKACDFYDEVTVAGEGTLERDGYRFIGWNTKADGSGTSYSVDDKVIITTDLALYAQWNDGVTYELNGGVTNEYGWTNASDMFDSFMSETGATGYPSLEQYKSYEGNDRFKSPTGIGVKLTNPENAFANTSKWGWLKSYIAEVQNAQNAAGLTPAVTALDNTGAGSPWRYAVAAFFVDDQCPTWPVSANFATCGAGTLSAYQAAWGFGYANPQFVDAEFTLNAPYKAGYAFAGWYDNAEFTGTPVTTIDENTQGTLYAKWDKVYTIYFYDNMSWGDVHVNLYAGPYWNNENGSGNNGAAICNAQMTKIGETNYWKYEFTGGPYSVVSFTSIPQYDGENDHGYEHFYNCDAVYRGDFDATSENLMFVSTATSNETKNECAYYSNGVWMKYASSYSFEVANTNYRTLCLPYAATLDNAEIYTISSVSSSSITITSTNSNVIAAGTPYIIKPEAEGTVTATFSGEPTATLVNVDYMVGNLNATALTVEANGNNYVLSNNELHKVVAGEQGESVTVGQYKAYFYFDGVLNAAPALRVVVAENGATAIENIEANETAVKFIENGKLFIRKNGVVYDATGAVVK